MKQIFFIPLFTIAFTHIIFNKTLPTSGLLAETAGTAKVQQIQVTASSISEIPSQNKYVADLTRPDVTFNFDSTTAKPIDFNRVVVRTASGELPISSWLKTKFSEKSITGWQSKPLRIGTINNVRKLRGITTIRKISSGQSAFQCNFTLCSCQGDGDCNDMFGTNVCGEFGVCVGDVCVCSRI